MMDFVIDGRCYQDKDYAFRGIGYSTMSLLRHIPDTYRQYIRFIALVSGEYDPIPDSLVDVFDVVTRFPVKSSVDCIFFEPSPLTHEPWPAKPYLDNHNIYSVAFLPDFIPYDYPDVFQSPNDFQMYMRAVEATKRYDLYVPISTYTAKRGISILNVPSERMMISRIGARNAFFEKNIPDQKEYEHVMQLIGDKENFFLCVAGESVRKNIECAITAIQKFNESSDRNCRLVVVGRYSAEFKAKIYSIAGESVVFLGHITDAMMRYLYKTCIVSIVPSHVEGFSMPVVEAIASGGVVVASSCDAHTELVDQPEALFPSDDPEILCQRLLTLSHNSDLRDELRVRQASVVDELNEPTVAASFWERLIEHYEVWKNKIPAVIGRAKPKFAIVTPYMPQHSGLAISVTKACHALSEKADVDVFTDAAVDPAQHGYLHNIKNLEEAKNIIGYDIVLYVLGNCSYHHGKIYELATNHRRGHHVLLGDSLMINMQYDYRGEAAACAYASTVLNRSVDPAEYHQWMAKPLMCPILGFEDFFSAGWNPIVHSKVMQKEMTKRGVAEVYWIPHATLVPFCVADFDLNLRQRLRRDLGFSESDQIIVSMGGVSDVKGALECVMAMRELKDWGFSPKLYFVGGADENIRNRINSLAAEFCVSDNIVLASGYLTDEMYRNYLLAADVAIQLRKVPYGQTSGGLADCIGSGIITVANDTMGRAIDAPAFVLTVPDQFTPVLIAEKLADAFDACHSWSRDNQERRNYCESHSFGRFADGLLGLLP